MTSRFDARNQARRATVRSLICDMTDASEPLVSTCGEIQAMSANILVVDDDTIMCNAMRRTLEHAGYTVSVAHDGEDALQQMQTYRPDLVLLDVNMPRMDGFEALRRIRGDPELAAIFVVIVSSARTDTESQVHGLETGADGYLTRPISNRELIARVQAMLRIEAAEKALRQKERQMRDLIASNIDGMLVVNGQGHTLFANPAACALLDRTPQSIVGRQIGIPITAGEHTELDLLRPDGGRRVVEMRVAQIEWQSEPVFLAALRDITERKQLEEIRQEYAARLEERVAARTRELRAAQEQLVRQERLAVLGQLAGSAGHELRNPLGVIANAVYFLRLVQPQATPKIQEYLTLIADETHAAGKIVDDLLDFSRQQMAQRTTTTVAQLLQRALERFPPPAQVTVRLDLPADLPAVRVDPGQLTQVFGNLIVNACQAMPNGGELTLAATLRQDGWMAISVQDTGVGIPPENLPKLFEPLFTTKARGIGLGLAICRRLTEASGGQISVQSEPGKGSIFTVTLPGEEVD